jgi:hypothetical protein
MVLGVGIGYFLQQEVHFKSVHFSARSALLKIHTNRQKRRNSSLCKHRVRNMYGGGGSAFSELSTRWRSVVSFTHWPFFTSEKQLQYRFQIEVCRTQDRPDGMARTILSMPNRTDHYHTAVVNAACL